MSCFCRVCARLEGISELVKLIRKDVSPTSPRYHPLVHLIVNCDESFERTVHMLVAVQSMPQCDTRKILLTNPRKLRTVAEIMQTRPKLHWFTSLLQLACYVGNLGMVRWLVEREGARVNWFTPEDGDALMVAVGVNVIEIVQYLIRKGASLEPRLRNKKRRAVFWFV